MVSMGWQWASIKSGHHGLAAQVHQPGRGPRQLLDLVGAADLQDLAVLDGHRAGRGARGIEGDDLAVKVDRVRFGCRGAAGESGHHQSKARRR